MNNPATSSSAPLRLDVREIPPRTKHATIFRVWSALPVGSRFVLVNDHDPVPLYYQFTAQYAGAFDWEYLQRGPEIFEVKITRLQPTAEPAPIPPVAAAPEQRPAAPGKIKDVQEIDARGLEPPEPLIRILNALESLPAETSLRAWTDREPCHLFGEAEQRGFQHESNEQPDGSWITLLARA
jgi:uncharacterized protein (DUF2249 family)